MSRVPPIAAADAAPESRALLERHGETNMKRTLARVPAALDAYMRWYAVFDEVVAILGRRTAIIFAHAVSAQTDCLICSTFFRRWLTEWGENPDALTFDDRERALVAYGRQIAKDANGVDYETFDAVAAFLTPDQVVTITAFAGLMIATNVFNNALRVDLDEYLFPFRKDAAP